MVFQLVCFSARKLGEADAMLGLEPINLPTSYHPMFLLSFPRTMMSDFF